MNMKAEITEMENRIFSKEFIEAILYSHSKDMESIGFTKSTEEYELAKERFEAILTEHQKEELKKFEELQYQSFRLFASFAFRRGIYAGFRQNGDNENDVSFQTLVAKKLSSVSAEYTQIRNKSETIVQKLSDELDVFSREHLISFDSEWNEREMGVLRYSFCLGYHYSHSIVMDSEPIKQIELLQNGWKMSEETDIPYHQASIM